jgi:hypothetical protein
MYIVKDSNFFNSKGKTETEQASSASRAGSEVVPLVKGIALWICTEMGRIL